jgi:hypothetical protein
MFLVRKLHSTKYGKTLQIHAPDLQSQQQAHSIWDLEAQQQSHSRRISRYNRHALMPSEGTGSGWLLLFLVTPWRRGGKQWGSQDWRLFQVDLSAAQALLSLPCNLLRHLGTRPRYQDSDTLKSSSPLAGRSSTRCIAYINYYNEVVS